jgi:hypothetical protein
MVESKKRARWIRGRSDEQKKSTYRFPRLKLLEE